MAMLDFGDLSGTERAVNEAIDVGAVRTHSLPKGSMCVV